MKMKTFVSMFLSVAMLSTALLTCACAPQDGPKNDNPPEENPPVVTGPEFPAWVTQTEGATTVLNETVEKNELKQLYTKPSYTVTDTTATYQAVTMSLQLNKDATEEFKAENGAYVDLLIANNGEAPVYDETSEVVTGYSSKLRFYYYGNYSAFYFLYYNDNSGMLSWFTSDATDANFTQIANDFAAGRKIYINYQMKDVFEEIDGELVWKQLEFAFYVGVDDNNGGVAWMAGNTLYYAGENVWFYDAEGNTAESGCVMGTTQYNYNGYQQKDAYVFVGGAATFSLTIADVAFSANTVVSQATVTTLPEWVK